MRYLLAAIGLGIVIGSVPATAQPSPKHEFRGAWIATVLNLDWPTSRGTNAALQQDRLVEMLDKLKDAGIKVIVAITDGIPVQDMVRVKRYLIGHDTIIVGPNTAGVITPNECKAGIMPAHIYQPGPIGLVSRSGTLNYEAVEQMNELGLGQTTSISIGGDPVNGCDFLTILKQFAEDDATRAVLMIGEIGGNQEVEAARWARENMEKPLVAFIAGATAPPGRRMGHAGTVNVFGKGGAAEKIAALEAAGALIAGSPAEIGETMRRALAG